MVPIHDGPHQNEEIDVNETVWRSGVVLIPERIRPALRGDIFTEPRIARYTKRRRHRAGVVFWVWVWGGWHK
jgi:hypothetical protein